MCVFQKSVSEINDETDQISSKNNGLQVNIENFQFGIKVSELKELMQLKSAEVKYKINNDYDGIDGLAKKLCTSLQNGITEDKEILEKRILDYGKNVIPPKKPKSIFALAFEAVKDTTLLMLIVCAIISIGLSFYHPDDEIPDEEYLFSDSKGQSNLEWVEGVAIMIAVIVVVFVTAFNDWKKERQFRGLQNQIEKDHMASVIRNGLIRQINIKDILVGDICLIKYGDLVPADGIITQASDLKIDESSLTGETDLIKKTEHENINILSGKLLIYCII
jgi:Ca2+ transporting ATPase